MRQKLCFFVQIWLFFSKNGQKWPKTAKFGHDYIEQKFWLAKVFRVKVVSDLDIFNAKCLILTYVTLMTYVTILTYPLLDLYTIRLHGDILCSIFFSTA